MPLFYRIRVVLKRNFISGALVVAPLILTFILLKFLFESIDGILAPLVTHLVGYSIPGLGLITTGLLILLVGILTRNLVGSRLLRWGEAFLNNFPGVRTIYGAAKQLVEGVSLPNKQAFKQVVLVEYPRRGVYALAFSVKRPELVIDGNSSPMVCLFVPSTPTPVSGMVILAPAEDVVLLDMTIEEGFRFLVSGGIASPQSLNGSLLATVDSKSGSDLQSEVSSESANTDNGGDGVKESTL